MAHTLQRLEIVMLLNQSCISYNGIMYKITLYVMKLYLRDCVCTSLTNKGCWKTFSSDLYYMSWPIVDLITEIIFRDSLVLYAITFVFVLLGCRKVSP